MMDHAWWVDAAPQGVVLVRSEWPRRSVAEVGLQEERLAFQADGGWTQGVCLVGDDGSKRMENLPKRMLDPSLGRHVCLPAAAALCVGGPHRGRM